MRHVDPHDEYGGRTTYKVNVIGYPFMNGMIRSSADFIHTPELLVQSIIILSNRAHRSNRATITFSSAVIRR